MYHYVINTQFLQLYNKMYAEVSYPIQQSQQGIPWVYNNFSCEHGNNLETSIASTNQLMTLNIINAVVIAAILNCLNHKH